MHKKIALNSLIAEKILSIEFDKYKYELTDSQRSMIQGQKEQAMRHLMLKKIGFEVFIEEGAGNGASFSDKDYKNAGAKISRHIKDLYQNAKLTMKTSF